MAIIEVNHVTKEYRLGQLHSLKQSALDAFARVRGQPVLERALFKALDDVDFKVEQGEVLGIIGHNGAGKSTLLKLLAGISTPTRGNVKIDGTVAPLIEVGAGLVPDLTGRENIYLNGVILGMPRAGDQAETSMKSWHSPNSRSSSIRLSSATAPVCRCDSDSPSQPAFARTY